MKRPFGAAIAFVRLRRIARVIGCRGRLPSKARNPYCCQSATVVALREWVEERLWRA